MTVQEERFSKETLARAIIDMVQRSDVLLPQYQTDTRKRDKALQVIWRSESLLSGVISATVARDKNRGWTLTGTSGLVSKFAKKLHNVHNGMGWRNFISLNSTAWYTSNAGYVSEIVYKDGKQSTMNNIDSTRVKLSNDPNEPLTYYKRSGRVLLKRDEIVHSNSMPSFEEEFNYAGFCSVERALLFTKLMIGLHHHQLEKLQVAPPKGILFGTGIDRREWENAIESYSESKSNDDLSTYDGVMGLFARDPNAKIQMLGLSQLPDNFSLDVWLDNIMKAYSLAFGVPVYTYWTPESGTFGRGKEVDSMRKASTYIGELEFSLSFQEQIQKYFLPSSVLFDFNMRDGDSELQKLEMNEKIISQILLMKQNEIITHEEARDLLVSNGVLPVNFSTGVLTEKTQTDLYEIREKVRSNLSLRNYYRNTPNEPLVVYQYEPLEKNYRFVGDLGNVDKIPTVDYKGRWRVIFNDYSEYNKKEIF